MKSVPAGAVLAPVLGAAAVQASVPEPQLSAPFVKAAHIKTPNLSVGGDKDFNVPIAGGEQIYQALQSLTVTTQLVIDPVEHPTISRPSFVRESTSASWLGMPSIWAMDSRARGRAAP